LNELSGIRLPLISLSSIAKRSVVTILSPGEVTKFVVVMDARNQIIKNSIIRTVVQTP